MAWAWGFGGYPPDVDWGFGDWGFGGYPPDVD